VPLVGMRQIYVDNIKIDDRNIGFRMNSYGPSQRNVAGIFRTVMKQTDAFTQNFVQYITTTFDKRLGFIKFKVDSDRVWQF
jgi:hypothetical protein